MPDDYAPGDRVYFETDVASGYGHVVDLGDGTYVVQPEIGHGTVEVAPDELRLAPFNEGPLTIKAQGWYVPD